MELEFRFNSDCKLNDILAAFDTYVVRLIKGRKTLLEEPIEWLGATPKLDSVLNGPIEIDQTLRLELIDRGSHDNDDCTSDGSRRWPFFTSSHLELWFAYGLQWWKFEFNPGKEYRERSIGDERMQPDGKQEE